MISINLPESSWAKVLDALNYYLDNTHGDQTAFERIGNELAKQYNAAKKPPAPKDKTVIEASYEQRCNEIAVLQSGSLTDWESGFLNSIRGRNTISDKQAECYERIKKKYLPKDRTDLVIPNLSPSDDMVF